MAATDTPQLRRLEPADARAVMRLYASLDRRDSYFRFFAPQPKDLDRVADTATRADTDHAAVGAFLNGDLVGVANYIDVGETPRAAEVAMIVAHDEQSHGIGTALLARIVEIARENGVQTLIAAALAENSRVMRLIMDAPYPIHACRDGAVVQVTIDIGAS